MERGHDEAGVGSYTRIALHFATFCIRHKARTCNAHVHTWPVVGAAWHLFDFAHSQHALNDTAKHDMLAVEEFGRLRGDKKLGKYAQRTWHPLLWGPAFAILSRPGASCFNMKFSSANLSP